MTRAEQRLHNQRIIDRVDQMVRDCRSFRAPSYRQVIDRLNADKVPTSRGNAWTRKSLFRMLQRQGIRGLHGLFND